MLGISTAHSPHTTVDVDLMLSSPNVFSYLLANVQVLPHQAISRQVFGLANLGVTIWHSQIFKWFFISDLHFDYDHHHGNGHARRIFFFFFSMMPYLIVSDLFNTKPHDIQRITCSHGTIIHIFCFFKF